ncbi:Ig-like domain-containing protein [Pseudomonas sp. SCB32]|uniref:Ig-like domain-containing protein n=1 Tax=Pseudomonas sp. SCB32 TaxID=2653853 RepID=UPI0012644130|nr:Ig-like domain-containing protein [Pseudomonas sp. SCB32]
MAIENIGLVAVTESAAKKVALKAGGKIKAHSGTKYLLQVENSDVAPENVTVKRVGKDLQISFEGSEEPDLTITDFFEEGMDSQLYGVAEDGQLYAYVRTDGEGFGGPLLLADGESAPIALGGDALADGAAYLASTFDDAAGFVLWPWLLGLAGVGAAAAAIIHHNRDGGGHHDTPTSPAPTNIKAIDDVGPIQGELHNGDITDDSHPEISGNGVPGAIIHIFDNGQEIGSTTVAADGTWSFTPDLADGAHNIDITQEVPGQKPSAPVNVVDIVVDTTAPAAPTAEIEGAKTDGEHTYSNDDTPTIHGNGEPGDTIIIVFPTGESVTTVVAEDGTWVAPQPTQPLPEGNNDIKVIEQDPAGNQTEIIVPVIIDTIAPAAPEVHLDPDSDTGIKGDDITSDTKPTIDGKTEPGADVTVIFPNGEEIHTKADDNGDWSVTPTQPLPEGNNDITVIATDPAGNQSEPTVISVVIDTTAPAVPEAHLDPESDSGIKGDNITNDTTPTIDGKTEPGAEVTVTFPTGEVVTTTADANGDWSVTPTQPLPEGNNDITVVATDPAGNASEPTVIAVVIDTQAPDAPDAWLDPASDSGTKGDNITNETKPTIDGTTEPGADVTVTFPTGEVIHTQADDEGNWHVTPTQELPEGKNDITVIATDPAGNASEPTVISVEIDTTAPDASQLAITGVLDDVGLVTGNIENGGTTDDSHPTISGTGTAGDVITVYTQDSTGHHPIGSTVVGEDGNWSLTPELPLNSGLNELTAVETDVAGNSTTSQPYDITLDMSAPTAPTIESVYDDVGPYQGFLQKGDVTDDNKPTFNGSAEAGSTVKLYDGNNVLIGSATADANGHWSITPEAALADGPHEVYATATNSVGVLSEPTGLWPFSIDTSAPSNVTDLVVTDDVGAVTGPLHDGDTTDDNRPDFSGDAEPGSKVIIYDNGEKIGEADVGDDGKWAFTPTEPLADGEHAFTTEVLDEAGNSSGQNDPLHVIVDTRDVVVSITHVIDDVGSITGDIAPHGVTDDVRPEIQGTGKSGSTITVYDGEVELGTTIVDAKGNWSFTPASDLAEGAHEIRATATDKSGNVSDPAKFDFSIDTTAPNKPSIDQVYDDVGTIQGPIANGGVTDDSTPTISGKAEAGSIVTVYDNGEKLGSVTADKDGDWSYTPTTPLSEGAHEFTVDATDKAGNTSPKSDPFDIVTDYTAPDMPSITGVIDNVGEVTGNIPNGGKTDDSRPVIHGEGTAGDTITVYANDPIAGNHPIGSTVVAEDGTWSLTPETPLNVGLNDLTAVETDAAGNSTQPSEPYSFDFDPKEPGVPVIVSVLDDVGPYTGFLQKGDITDDNKPTINGTAEAGSTVKLYDGNNVLIGSATADADGNWSITPEAALADGKHEVYATATNDVGVVSPQTGKWDFIVDTSAPDNVTNLVVTDDVGAVTGPLHDGDTTDDNRPTFSGDAEPNGKVIIYDNGNKIGEADVDADGKWEFTPTTPLKDGDHAFTTEVLDEAGNSSGQNDPLHVIVDTSALGVVITHVIDDVGSVTGDIAPNGVTDDKRPEIQGTSKPGSIVKLYDGSVELGSVTADAKGNWSFTPGSDLAEGPHNIAAIATDKAGNVSDPAKFHFTVDTTAPDKPSIDSVYDDVGSIQGPIENGGVTDDSTPTISGKAEAGSTVVVYDNGQKLGSVVADADGKWSYTPTTPISEGQHDFTVDATDKAGNTSPKSDVFTIITDYTAPDADKLAITGVEDHVGTITGNIDNGGTTDDPRPVIHGTGTAGDIVTVYTQDSTGNHKIGSAVVDADGNWSMKPELPLVSGLNDLTAVETDPAGNSTKPSDTYSITFDATAPQAPVIVSVYDDVGPYQGFLQKGDVTDDNKPTIAGTAQAGSVVRLYDNNDVLIGSTTADAKGNWSITPATALADGKHEVYATATNAVGVVSDPTGKWDFTVDTGKPSNVTDLVVTDNVGDVTGPLHEGDTTDDNKPTFSGDAEPNGKVIIYDNGAKIGEADVDADGKWEFTPTTPLADGDHAFTTEVLDQAGNSSGQGDKLDVIVDTSKVGVQIIHVIDDVGSITGDIAPNGVTDDKRPEIQGTSKPGSIVKIYDGSVELGSTTVDSKGNWTFTPKADLADGAHSIQAIATDKAGQVSDPAKFDFTVDTTAPSKPSIDSVYDDVGSIQGPVENGGVTDDSTPTLSGKAEAGSTVVIYDNGDKLGSTTADKDGKWSYTPTTPISEGEHKFTVDATDKAGNVSPKSDPFTIITDYTGPNDGSTKLTIDNVTSDNAISSVESKGNVTISGKVTGDFTAGDKVTFVLDGTTYSADVKADGTWGVDVPGSKLVDDAAHEIDATLVAHDAAGNAGTITASHPYLVQLNSVSITSMSKDTAIDLAHASDFITADGSAGRGVYGTVEQTLATGQKVQVSFDKGVTWVDAVTTGTNWVAVDAGAHTADWTIQARVVANGVAQTDVASKDVSFLGSAGNAPTITGIPDAVGVYTTAKAADGSDVDVSLTGTNAKVGDTLHIVWGDTTYDQVLTAADISAGKLTVTVPAEQTKVQGGQWDFAVTAQIVTPEGQISKPSEAFQVHSEGWTTLAIDDLQRNVAQMGSEPVYQGGGITITSNSNSLAHFAGDATGNVGLRISNPATNYAQINFTQPVDSFSINIGGLQNTQGGSRVIVYDVDGKVLSDRMVLADGTGGVASSANYSYSAPVGVDIGQVKIYGDGVDSYGEPGGGITIDTLKFHQVHHAPGYNDSFTDEVGNTTTGAGYHSDEGHFTLTSQGTVTIKSAPEHNLDGPYLYIGSGASAINSSAAIFTFDQPVQSIAYNLWGLETQEVIPGNYSKLEVYDTNGALIFSRNVTNNGGGTYNYEQISYTAPEGINIGKAVVYQGAHGTMLDNFTSILAPSAPSGQKLIDHNWETFFDEASVTKAVSWKAQVFTNGAFTGDSSLAGYHSTSGDFTISGSATKTAGGGNQWVNANNGSMFVDNNKTAVVTFDSARSKVEIGATGIEKGNTAYVKVFDVAGSLLDTITLTNPNGQSDVQWTWYETDGNSIGRIEITGESGGTHITSISSAVTQVTAEHDVISMVVDPVAYFAQDSAHIFGSSGMDTLKLTGANQVLDLTKLTGDNGEAKISSIEKFDITGTGDNTLKISLNDVLHLGETDMFQKDGKVQVMVDGDAGDKVQLANLHDHGTAPGTWQAAGTTSIGGATYQVYSYSNLDAEVLIKQAVTASIV